jgi:tetraacyldisaccharide 4'-kinase
MQKKRLYFAVLLFPVSVLYGLVISLRNLFFDQGWLRSVRFGLPVISVGNITVGGTGKTPHVAYLLKLLGDKYNIAVLSRGYKRRSKGFLLAGDLSTANEIGDEPRQIKSGYPFVNVAVDGDRVHGINSLIKAIPSLDAIILDDAFQHRYVSPGLSIVLVDYERPVFNDFMLPLGNLRECRRNINRADMIIVTKCPLDLDNQRREAFKARIKLYLQRNQPIFFTGYRYANLKPVWPENTRVTDLHGVKEDNPAILLVTGIANSRPLKVYLEHLTTQLTEMRFSDHHYYTDADILAIEKRFAAIPSDRKIIITTEKDAARLREMRDKFNQCADNIYYIPVEVVFPGNDDERFNGIVKNVLTDLHAAAPAKTRRTNHAIN